MGALSEELVSTLRALVAVDSTSERSNAPVIELLEPRLAALGVQIRKHPYRDDAGVEKINMLGLTRSGSWTEPAELALVGHTDCVPYAASWREALALTERDGRLFGRGACDTKGFIACALVAASRVDLKRLRRPLLLAFTADEEVGCVGLKKLVEAKMGHARYAIVGEPTSGTPVRAHKGYCLAEVEVRGVEGHSAYPQTGASAVFRAARFLRRLEEAASTALAAEVDPAFQPPHTTVNVGLISGGTARNVIPGSCRFTVEWRPIPRQSPQRMLKLLEQIRSELEREEPGFQADIRFVRHDPGVDTPESSELVRFLVAESKRAAGSVPFGTEAPYVAQLGAEPVVFGPGDIRVAHQTDEHVAIDELLGCEEILERAIRHFCAG